MEIAELYKCFMECGKVTTDSRNCPEGSMFIALKGETFNGNAFAAQALKQGFCSDELFGLCESLKLFFFFFLAVDFLS